MTDEPTPQDAIEDSATTRHEFHGQPLNPFAFDHNACWQRMGFEMQESEFEALVAIVFLCTFGREIVEGDKTGLHIIRSCRGAEAIEKMRDRLSEWTTEHNVNGNTDDGLACKRLGVTLWNEMSRSRFAPKVPSMGTAGPNG